MPLAFHWRPDTARRRRANVERAIAPDFSRGCPLVVGSVVAMKASTEEDAKSINRPLEDPFRALPIHVLPFFGHVCAVVSYPLTRCVRTQEWAFGVEPAAGVTTLCIQEFAQVHALKLARRSLAALEPKPQLVQVLSGGNLARSHMCRWMNRGGLIQRSETAKGDTAGLLQNLARG